MKSRLSILALCVLAAILVFALAGGGGSRGTALDPVAEAAQTTLRAGGAQAAITGSVEDPAANLAVTLSGGGTMNFRSGEGEFTLTLGGLPAEAQAALNGRSLTMKELFASGALYIDSPVFAGKLPGGARWIKLDLAQVTRAIGLDPSSLANGEANPAEYLNYLRGHGATLAVVGHEPVRGVGTTRYSGSLSLLKAAESEPNADMARVRAAIGKLVAATGHSSYPVEVWIDAQHLVRRVSMHLSLKTAGERFSERIEIEYFDFGVTPSVTPPGSSEVADITSQALAAVSPAG